jgi:hypothetical protein
VKKNFLLPLFIVLTNGSLLSQELNGIWKGTLTQRSGGCFPVYNLELQINISNTLVNGINYHYSDVLNYVKKDFSGSYFPSTKTITISEGIIKTFHIPRDCIPCVKQYALAYKKDGDKETLTGEWSGVIVNGGGICQPGNIVLTRQAISEFNHIKEIKVDTGTIRLDFYDNGVVDGDTISVLLNDKILVSRKRLELKPVTVEVTIDMVHLEQEITMLAENLGSIPPNTALLIVTAGKKRYQLYVESTNQKNAQVRFIYEKPK